MKAIILSAGIGSRLMPETQKIPKALLKLNGKTILDIELENLASNGIQEIIIVTGHKHEMVKQHVTENYPDLNVAFVVNQEYETTNYIYSIWLTKELVDDDIVILHGDMVFEGKLLEKLFTSPSENAALVNNVITPPEKDFKAIVNDDVIKEIGVECFGQNAFFCAPIYRFSMFGFSRWLDEIDRFVVNGDVLRYAEDAFNNISDEVKLHAVYYSDEFCMEIDTPEDLDTAKAYYAKQSP
jgi:phosphoenolpyruvate phosphomutase